MKFVSAYIFIFLLIIGILAGCTSGAQTAKEFAGTSINGESDEHEYSVQVSGSEMKKLTIRQIATMWDISAQGLLDKIVTEYNLKNKYTVDSVLEDLRSEFKFSPAMIKDIAEKMKLESTVR